MYLNNYTNSLIKDNLNVVASSFHESISDSNISITPISCTKNNNKNIANSPDLGQKNRPNTFAGKLSRMSRSIQSTPKADKKKVLFVAEDQQYLFLTISRATEKQRAVLEVIFKFMDDETSTSALLHKTILEEIPGLSLRTLERVLQFWRSKGVINSHQKVHARGQWGANRYSSIYAASGVRHYLAVNSSIKTRVLNNTINMNSHSKEMEVKKRKPSYKSRDPEKIIEVKDAWPCRKAQKFLNMEAPGYLRQQMIVSDYNALLISQGKTSLTLREYNYGFFPFYKQRKNLSVQHGDKRIPLTKHLAWKENPNRFKAKTVKKSPSSLGIASKPFDDSITDFSDAASPEDFAELKRLIRGY